MPDDLHAKLKLLGLSAPEAEVYLALVRDGGPVSASLVCDWQTVGANHIHMTVRAKLKS